MTKTANGCSIEVQTIVHNSAADGIYSLIAQNAANYREHKSIKKTLLILVFVTFHHTPSHVSCLM